MENKANIKTIGVMTSGGDAPGMNPCIRAVVRTAVANGVNVIGIEEGYVGLVNGSFKNMGARDVGGIMQYGGTILQTARSKEFPTPAGRSKALREMNSAGMDALVVIGGDGSLSGAQTLHQQNFPVVGIPASIDNDIFGTDTCIGVDTAMNTIMDTIDKLRDTASSHNRAFLIETMGRKCGYLAQQSAITSGAELALIPEKPLPVEDVIKTVENAYIRGKRHCIIVVAEGYRPTTTEISNMINAKDIGFDTRVTILGHVQRGGRPTAFDRLVSTRFGVKAVEMLLDGQTGVMTALSGRGIDPIPLEMVINNQRPLSHEYFKMGSMLAK